MTLPSVKHLRYLPFNMAFTLDAAGDLMCTPLRDDKSYSEDIADYHLVDMGDSTQWDESDEKALVMIYETLLNIRK